MPFLQEKQEKTKSALSRSNTPISSSCKEQSSNIQKIIFCIGACTLSTAPAKQAIVLFFRDLLTLDLRSQTFEFFV